LVVDRVSFKSDSEGQGERQVERERGTRRENVRRWDKKTGREERIEYRRKKKKKERSTACRGVKWLYW